MEFCCKTVNWQILANIKGWWFPVSFIFSCHGKISFFPLGFGIRFWDTQVKQPTIKKVLSTDSGMQFFNPKWHWKQPSSLKHYAEQAEIFLRMEKAR